MCVREFRTQAGRSRVQKATRKLNFVPPRRILGTSYRFLLFKCKSIDGSFVEINDSSRECLIGHTTYRTYSEGKSSLGQIIALWGGTTEIFEILSPLFLFVVTTQYAFFLCVSILL